MDTKQQAKTDDHNAQEVHVTITMPLDSYMPIEYVKLVIDNYLSKLHNWLGIKFDSHKDDPRLLWLDQQKVLSNIEKYYLHEEAYQKVPPVPKKNQLVYPGRMYFCNDNYHGEGHDKVKAYIIWYPSSIFHTILTKKDSIATKDSDNTKFIPIVTNDSEV